MPKKQSWADWLEEQVMRAVTPIAPIAVPSAVVASTIARNPHSAMQIPAGAVEGTIANSSQHKGSYRPAIVDQVPALVGSVAALARGHRMDRSNLLEQYVENSMDRAQLASDRTNRTLGIDNPANTGETLMRVGGSLAIPVKGSGIVHGIESVVPRAVGVARRVAAVTPRPIRAAARIATEMALPGRNTSAVGAVPAAAIATGLQDTVLEHVDPKYHSDIHETDKFNPENEFAALEGQPSLPEVDKIEEDQKQSNWATAAEVVGALGLGTAAIKLAPKVLDMRLQQATEGLPSFTGKQFRRSRGGIVERATAATVQQDQPLRNAADEFLSPQQASEYKFDSDLINNVSIGARAANFFRTGRMPKVPQRTVKLAPMVEAYAKELNLDEQRQVSDALLAQSALDDVDRTGTHAALNLSRDGSPVSPTMLRSMVASARANPKYSKYMDAVTQSYRDLLKFRVARGLLSPEMAQELATKRPNYVRMSRDLETEAKKGSEQPFNANKARSPGYSRNDEELQGVQGITGVGNPINNLLDDWANEIRRAEHNDLRRFWLENMSQANPQLVRRIPNGVTPNTTEGLHTVRVNGVDIPYKVNDAIASNALEFAPRATNKGMEVLRQVAQNTVTGPLGTLTNGFSFFKSPIYDTTMGMLLKPKDTHLGVINEALSKISPHLSIGHADPTALISAYTGAARYAWDDLRGGIAQNLTDQLIREHSWLRTAIGDAPVTALRDRFEQAYENSIKSMMEEQGISSLTMHGSPDPSKVMEGLQGITPRFSNAMAEQLAKDTSEARAAGQVGPLQQVLANGKSDFARIRAGSIARLYSGLLEAAHNGFRYSTVASNISRNSNLKKLAAQARRISVDSAQHGGSDKFNKLASSFMYGNLTIQSLHATGKMIAENPARFLANASSIILPLAAMHYLALATDDKAKEQHAGKSAAQKAASVTTFGGAEIPVDPVLRLAVTPMFTLLDHITGAHDNKWNRPFLDSLASWIENDNPDDNLQQDMHDALWADVKANFPFAPEAFPAGNAVLAIAGADPGMSRVTGEVAPIHNQAINGFDMDQKRTDSLTSGYTENMVTALGGSFLQNLLNIANDAYRAYGATGDPHMAVAMGLSRYRDTLAKGAAEARPLIFGNYEQVHAVTDTNWQIVKAKEAGIDQATTLYNENVRAGGIGTGVNSAKADQMPSDIAPPVVAGTVNAAIASAASNLQSSMRGLDKRLSDLTQQSEGIRNGYVTSADQKNRKLNELTEQRRYYTLLKRNMIEQYEHSIGTAIGNPDFSFEDYNPRDYTMPMPTAVAPAAQ